MNRTEKKNVVVIGGGTGTFTLLRGLKQYHRQINISAVVTMADSGGSTGRLRDEFGCLPVGDVRQALVALASDTHANEELLRKLFLHRFDKGGNGLSGHNFGNLFLVALIDILGNEAEAIKAAGKVLRVHGRVIPVTKEKVDLVAVYDDGVRVVGEHDIDEPTADRFDKSITELSLTNEAVITSAAESTILDADVIVLGPGDLYTSVLANCVVDGVAEAIRHSPGKLVYVANLMTRAGQTLGKGVSEMTDEITRYVERAPDVVLANTGEFPSDLLKKYETGSEFPVALNVPAGALYEVVALDLLAREEVQTISGDTLKRSLIRHDPRKLARKIVDLVW